MRIDNIRVTGSIANSGSLATLSGSFSGSFAGNGEEITGIISSSYATTASYAISSSHEVLQEITSSYADTASLAQLAENVHWEDVAEKPNLLSGSATYATTASNTFIGDQIISGSLIVTSSGDSSIRNQNRITLGSNIVAIEGRTLQDEQIEAAQLQVSGTIDVTGITILRGGVVLGDNVNDDIGLGDFISFTAPISSSIVPTSSNEYDLGTSKAIWRNAYIDNLTGTASVATTASMALEAQSSYTAEFATSASYIQAANIDGEITASAVDFDNITNKPVLYSGSAQLVDALDGQDLSLGVVSASILHEIYTTQSINQGSGSFQFGDTLDDTHTFTGSVNITGSLNLVGNLEIDGITDVSASIASLEDFSSSLDATFATDSELQNLIDKTSSYATTSSVNELIDKTGSYATTSSVNELIDKTGSYATTGSNTFTDNQTINASTLEIDNTGDAQIVLDRGANSNDAEIVFQTNNTFDWTIGTGQVGGDADFTIRHQNNNNIFRLSGTGLNINTSVSASEFSGSFRGNGSQLTGLVSASHAETASYADKIKVDFVNDDFEYGLMLVNNPSDNQIQIGTTDQTTGDLTYNPLTRALNVSGTLSASDAYFVDSITLLNAMDLDLTAQNTGDGHLTASNVLVRGNIEILGSVTASNLDVTASKALSVQNSGLVDDVNIPLLYGVSDPTDPDFSFVTSNTNIYYRNNELYLTGIRNTGSIISTGSITITDGRLEGVDAQISGAFTADSASFATVLDGVITDVDNLMLFSASATSSLEELYDRTDALQSVTGSYVTTASAQFDGNVGITGSLSVSQSVEIVGDITSVGKILQNRNQRSTFIGFEAGENEDAGNRYNVGLGYRSLCNLNDGTRNVAIGFNAMDSLDGGDRNVGIGSWAGAGVVMGNENTYIGVCAGADMEGGNRSCNVGIGFRAAYQATVGNHNTSIGTLAGMGMTSGSGNVQIGWRAGNALTTGQYNIAIGTNSDWSNICGDCNVVIGYNARNGGTIDDHVIVIGANAVGRGEHTVTIGSSIISSSRLYGTLEIDGISDVSASIAALESGDLNLPDGTVSSSAQLASDISGAFTTDSASFSSSIASLETFSSSLDATFATEVELNNATSSLSGSIASTIEDVIDGTITVTSSSYAVTASYTLNALTASYAISSSHEIIQEITSSYAETASYALRAEVEITKEVSSSNADTASYVHIDNIDGEITADSIHFDNITNKPTLLSGSLQIADDISGSFNSTSASIATDLTTAIANVSGAFTDTSGSLEAITRQTSASLMILSESFETYSSSLDATYATEVELNAATQSLSSSIATDLTTVIANVSGAFTSTSASIATNISASDARLDILDGLHLVSGSNDTVVINNITASNFYTDGFYYGDGRHLTGVSASLIQNGLLFGDGLLGGTYTGVLDVTSSIDTSSAHFITGALDAIENHPDLVLNGTFIGDGSGLTGLMIDGVLSSSAQIATEISGAFTEDSSSFNNRINIAIANVSGAFASDSASIATDINTVRSNVSGAFDSISSSIATDLTTAIANVSGAFDSISSSLSTSVATNIVGISANTTAIATLNDAGLLSSSFQISDDISGSFNIVSASLAQRLTNQEEAIGIDSSSFATTASFITGSGVVGTVNSSSHAITASYALNALTASYAISSSHEIIQEITSSYAETASYALRAEVEITKEISSSIADTASYVHASDIEGDLDLTIISASHLHVSETGSISWLNIMDQVQLNGPGSQYFAYNEDTVKVKFANWYASNSNQFGQTQLWHELAYIATNNTPHRRISFYLDIPDSGSTDSVSGVHNAHGTNQAMFVDSDGLWVTNNLHVSGTLNGDGSGLTGISADSVDFDNITNKPALVSGSDQLDGYVSQSADFVANEFIVANGANSVTSSNLLSVDMTEQRIGIGTSSPTVKLDIVGNTGGEAQMRLAQHDDSTDGPDMRFFKSRGTADSPSAVNADDYIGAVNAFSYDGSNYQQSGFFGFQSLGTGGEANFSIKTRLDGAFPDRLSIDGEGDVHISGDLFAPTITGSLLRLSENGQGMRLTNVGGFENFSGTFNIFSNNDIFLRAGGSGDSFAVATLHQSNQRAEFHGQVSASLFSGSFVGDGSGLTGLAADSVDFDNITNTPTLISGSAQITDLTTYAENVSGNTTYTITHNLNERYPIVQAWNTTNHNMEIPSSVVSSDVNELTVTFAVEFAGRIIVKK